MRFSPRLVVTALLGAIVLLVTPSSDLLAQRGVTGEQDHLLGTWRLDVAKSKYSPGPPLKSETRTYTRDEAGVQGRIDRQYADGRREVIDYRADFDREVPVSGTKAYDAVRLKRIDAYTTEGVLSHAGRVFGVSRRVISTDGQTMTITFRREERGDMVNNFAVYHKEHK
jgi:hypothetical protein